MKKLDITGPFSLLRAALCAMATTTLFMIAALQAPGHHVAWAKAADAGIASRDVGVIQEYASTMMNARAACQVTVSVKTVHSEVCVYMLYRINCAAACHLCPAPLTACMHMHAWRYTTCICP